MSVCPSMMIGEKPPSKRPRKQSRVRHVAKRSSDPLVADPEVKIQVRDLVRVVGIVVPFAPRGSVFE